jgi:tetratricopeptide (TPR) repeat protein
MELRTFMTAGLTILFGFSGAHQSFAKKTKADEAKTAYVSAQKLFKAEEYKMALPLFEKAYRLSGKKPASIMGLAQCERMLKMYSEAITHYQEYLKTQPKSGRQKRIKETLKILRAQQAQAKTEQAEAESKRKRAEEEEKKIRQKEAELLAAKLAAKMVQTQAPKAEEGSAWESPWLWLGLGVLVAGAATGAGFALAPEAELHDGTTHTLLRPE